LGDGPTCITVDEVGNHVNSIRGSMVAVNFPPSQFYNVAVEVFGTLASGARTTWAGWSWWC
jgi:hypothetical protein